jgi:hypothetical protein
MGEPVLRLVIPDAEDDRAQAPGWPDTGQPPAATAAPAQGATNPATAAATITAAEPGPPATDEATTAATNADAGTAAEPERWDGALPELEPIGRPMTAGERAARLTRHWLTQARADVMRPGELAHAVWHGKPESLAEIHDYAVSRAWVPDGYEGSLVPALGALYSHTVAKGGTALGLSIVWVTARALRLVTFLLVAGVLVALIVVFG